MPAVAGLLRDGGARSASSASAWAPRRTCGRCGTDDEVASSGTRSITEREIRAAETETVRTCRGLSSVIGYPIVRGHVERDLAACGLAPDGTGEARWMRALRGG
jgi:hypothetical protein